MTLVTQRLSSWSKPPHQPGTRAETKTIRRFNFLLWFCGQAHIVLLALLVALVPAIARVFAQAVQKVILAARRREPIRTAGR